LDFAHETQYTVSFVSSRDALPEVMYVRQREQNCPHGNW
jgi:hypothetical protein